MVATPGWEGESTPRLVRRIVLGAALVDPVAPTAATGGWVITLCAVRGTAARVPAGWRDGYLRCEPQWISWFQRFRVRRRPLHFDPAALTVSGLRDPDRPDDDFFFRGELPPSSWTIVSCDEQRGDGSDQVEFGLPKRHADVLLSRLPERTAVVFRAGLAPFRSPHLGRTGGGPTPPAGSAGHAG
jgi:hypothetical protein